MEINALKIIKKMFDPKKITTTAQMVSDTKTFLSKRLEHDKNLAPSISVYLFFLGIHVYLLVAVLDHVGLELESVYNFIASQVLVVVFLALSGHWSFKSLKIKSEYTKVIQATFYLYGPALVLTSLCIIIWLQAEMTEQLSFYVGLIFMLIVDMYWFGRSWNSLAHAFDCSKKQSVKSFILANIYYTPVMFAFWAVSGVLGTTV